ncbi:unnamed protein product [Didymodactylos carnosus]|uniref:SWIM-type domain-containing protein n=1 Tax=Didymodactylos carnosus TaxID=1234261 RepID=A0A813ZDK2_9BILA|nr:unnamed protein product [Didymodactylos carnosus]CAF0897901.1 unnamed protein product [Didymodactylos carnosus]CAF3674703.1 unnamed protein product [Didymodactylos carnosus]CAF3680857.1 unnamed protein product [Didymodactylos carnosus]
MITTATNGYILSVVDAFLADGKNHDASIAKNIFMKNEQDVLNWLRDDNVVIVDRGFRDAVNTIKRFGFNVEMPDFLKGKKQLSCKEANRSRCVTKPSILDNDKYKFTVEFSLKYKDLVRARFASRHTNSKEYLATVQFDEEDDEEPISGWYCTCSAGARVIGCCTHITALLWHLGVCRAQVNSPDHSLSANNYLSSLEDCIQYSGIDENDDEDVGSGESDSDEN